MWNVEFSFFHPDFRTFESLQPFLVSLPSKTADFFSYIFTACPKMPTSSSSVWHSQFSFPTDSDCTAVRITVLCHAIQLATSVYPEKNELRLSTSLTATKTVPKEICPPVIAPKGPLIDIVIWWKIHVKKGTRLLTSSYVQLITTFTCSTVCSYVELLQIWEPRLNQSLSP